MRAVFISLLLGSLYVAAYASVRTAGFVFEDRYVVELQSCCGSLAELTYGAQHGQTPFTFHLVSLALGLAVGAAVWLWLALLGLSPTSAAIGAAVVLLHPLSSEATAYIAAQDELLTTLLVISACVAALMAVRSCGWLVVAVAVAMLAGSGKETGLIACLFVPATLLMRRAWLRAAVSVAALLLIGGVAWGSRVSAIIGWSLSGQSLGYAWYIDPIEWLRWQATSAVRMIGMVPVPRGMSIIFDAEIVPLALQWLSVVWLGLLALAASVIWSRAWRVAVGIGWILACVAPRLVVQTPTSLYNEHQFYLAMPGAALIVASAWDYYSPERRRAHGRSVRRVRFA